MSNIKESNTKKEVNSYLAVDNGDIVSLMENEWPEMTSEFRRLQKEQYELFCHKQHDYGPGNGRCLSGCFQLWDYGNNSKEW